MPTFTPAQPLASPRSASRRLTLRAGAAAAALLLSSCASLAPPPARPPIVFVHGNGDNAALWMTTMWRFESNGWPRERLEAVDMPYPLARDDDAVAQPGRSSADDQARTLAAAVERVLQRTGATQVVLVGNSRGGNAIRHYVQNFGGSAKVSHAVLGGTPSHGVWADPAQRPRNEFNGAGAFLQALNAPKGAQGDEVTPGPRWMTLRSDRNDKFAQPEGTWIGQPGKPTNVSFDGPALKGATNVVLPGLDHREVSYHPKAFAETWTFVTGQPPSRTDIHPEAEVVLDGVVGGATAAGPTNLGLAGARVEVYAVQPDTGVRLGPALHTRTTGADGRWGPLKVSPTQPLEFVVNAPGMAITHVYRSPFPRSSSVVHLRPERLADADRAAKAVVNLTRPRGYFGLPRDVVELDGQQPAPGIPRGVAGESRARARLHVAPGRPVTAFFESGALRERLVGIAWPVRDNHAVVLELHH